MIPDVSKLMEWENGQLDEEETIRLFQQLIDSGLAGSLQGMYGRQAARLIEAGLCHRSGEPNHADGTREGEGRSMGSLPEDPAEAPSGEVPEAQHGLLSEAEGHPE